MDTHFGYLLDHWNIAKDQIRDLLIQRAKERRSITYGEVSAAVTVIELPANSYGMIAMLNELAHEDEKEKRGCYLATLVVRKSDGLPGPGYFKDAAAHGLNQDGYQVYWEAQFKKVCDYWADK